MNGRDFIDAAADAEKISAVTFPVAEELNNIFAFARLNGGGQIVVSFDDKSFGVLAALYADVFTAREAYQIVSVAAVYRDVRAVVDDCVLAVARVDCHRVAATVNDVCAFAGVYNSLVAVVVNVISLARAGEFCAAAGNRRVVAVCVANIFPISAGIINPLIISAVFILLHHVVVLAV